MLLIFLSWIYIFITATNFGFLFTKILKIQKCNLIIQQVLGLFFYTVTTCLFAFFIRINIEYYIFILLLNILIIYFYKRAILLYISALFLSFKTLKFQYKLLYIFLFFILLAQSSIKPYLIDNESYYIQTIKWINEYGYVKGLANVHMFFGQNSSWHTLQAGFNFSFLGDFYNDINGYLFTLFGFLSIKKLNDYNSKKNIQNLNLGLVLMFTLFLIQFVNAPSPDLPIFLITPYIFYLFIIRYKNINISDFKVILSLIFFLCFVKVTMAILSVILLILFVNNFKILKSKLWQYLFLSVSVLFLFLMKNAIISGYLLYPITHFDITNFDWKQPKELIELYKNGTYLAGTNNVDTSSFSFIEKLKHWLSIPKLHGVFNKTYILLLIIFPWFIYKSKNKASLLIIYCLAIFQLIILWFASPQYRFFFVFVCFLSIQIFTPIIKNKKAGVYLVSLSIILSAIPIFISIDLNVFTKNDFAMNLSTFKIKNIIIPEGNSKISTQFTKENVEGFEYYTPNEGVFFWATSNGDLPCVNKKQIEYIKYYYNYVPQLRTDNIKDGFKSVLIEK